MEKTIEQTSIGLILWQIFIIIIFILLVFFIYKYSKKVNLYLNLKIEYLKQKINKLQKEN
jgi:hypothetical protein